MKLVLHVAVSFSSPPWFGISRFWILIQWIRPKKWRKTWVCCMTALRNATTVTAALRLKIMKVFIAPLNQLWGKSSDEKPLSLAWWTVAGNICPAKLSFGFQPLNIVSKIQVTPCPARNPLHVYSKASPSWVHWGSVPESRIWDGSPDFPSNSVQLGWRLARHSFRICDSFAGKGETWDHKVIW